MILVDKLLYKLDLGLNKLASTEHQYIPLVDKILALNEAQINLIKQYVGSNNVYGIGLDGFKKRYNDLQNLIVQFEKLPATLTTEIYTSYKADLSTLANTYFLPLEITTTCTKGSCSNRVVPLTSMVRHGDLQVLLNNNNYKPSFEYQETIGLISDNQLYIYTDDTFTVNDIYITYLRYPVEMNKSGYINFDGTASTDVNCELEESLEDELLNLAILKLAMSTENTPQVEMSQIRRNLSE